MSLSNYTFETRNFNSFDVMMKEKNKFAIRKKKINNEGGQSSKKIDVLNHIFYTKTKILSEAIV